jgi:hypothetical protein
MAFGSRLLAITFKDRGVGAFAELLKFNVGVNFAEWRITL